MKITRVLAEEKNEQGTIYTVLLRRGIFKLRTTVTREVLVGRQGAQWLDTGESLPRSTFCEDNLTDELANQITAFHARQSRFKAAGL